MKFKKHKRDEELLELTAKLEAERAKNENLEKQVVELEKEVIYRKEREDLYSEKNTYLKKVNDALENVLRIKNEKLEDLEVELYRLQGNGPSFRELIEIVCGKDGYGEYRVLFPQLSDYGLLKLMLEAIYNDGEDGFVLKDIALKRDEEEI